MRKSAKAGGGTFVQENRHLFHLLFYITTARAFKSSNFYHGSKTKSFLPTWRQQARSGKKHKAGRVAAISTGHLGIMAASPTIQAVVTFS